MVTSLSVFVLGDMSESCRPIKQEKLEKVDPNQEESIPETTDRLVSGFLVGIGLILIAVALFCLASYTQTFNNFGEDSNQVVPSAPSIQTAYENQPANNPILGKNWEPVWQSFFNLFKK